jgi:hypothetical protein
MLTATYWTARDQFQSFAKIYHFPSFPKLLSGQYIVLVDEPLFSVAKQWECAAATEFQLMTSSIEFYTKCYEMLMQ